MYYPKAQFLHPNDQGLCELADCITAAPAAYDPNVAVSADTAVLVGRIFIPFWRVRVSGQDGCRRYFQTEWSCVNFAGVVPVYPVVHFFPVIPGWADPAKKGYWPPDTLTMTWSNNPTNTARVLAFKWVVENHGGSGNFASYKTFMNLQATTAMDAQQGGWYQIGISNQAAFAAAGTTITLLDFKFCFPKLG